MALTDATRPVALPIRIVGIPIEMQREVRWVVWNCELIDGRWTKVPYVATAPMQKADSTDPRTWRSFNDAVAAYEDGRADGIGFVLGDGWVGLDQDHSVDFELFRILNTYTERSPSGRGLHAIVRGQKPGPRCKNKAQARELYEAGRYFTVTGQHVEGFPTTVEARTTEIATVYNTMFPEAEEQRPAADVTLTTTPLDDDELLKRIRASKQRDKFEKLWRGDLSDYDDDHSAADMALCCMLAFWTGRDVDRIDRLFRRSGLKRDKWDRADYRKTTIERACAKTKDVYEPHALILDPGNPLQSARELVTHHHTVESYRALQHQRSVFYRFDSAVSAYGELDSDSVRAAVYAFLDKARMWGDEEDAGKLSAFKPTKTKVESVVDALRAVCNLPASEFPPCWLGDAPDRLLPIDILACRNGLLHTPTRVVYPATPKFFTLNGLDFDYDPFAPRPMEWLAFLDSLWPDDPESIATLQEIFGYALTPDTRFQKIFMVVGPKRSGKGTIARILRLLVGARNTCSPTLAAFGRDFGKQVLIGKTLALISDARISGRTDTAVVAETLLSISGEDDQTVERKFLPDWNGKLPVRFMLLANELPRITDASGALASRFIVLVMRESFFGKEDLTLFDRLSNGLPGILNWALEGRDRLYQRKHFVQPKSADQMIEEFNDLGSPETAFVKECCEQQSGEVEQSALFQAWVAWCTSNGIKHPGTTQAFARSLRAALPWLQNTQRRVGDDRVRFWLGLKLKESTATRLSSDF